MADLVRLPDVAMVAMRARGAAAADLPPVGTWQTMGDSRIVATGPDEWLAVARDTDAEGLLDRLQPTGATLVDVSGNRIAYRMSGKGARWFLSAGCALDLDLLTPGVAVSTLLARAQVIILAEANSFVVMPRRSFGAYLEAWAASVTA